MTEHEDRFEPTPQELADPATASLVRMAAMQGEQARQGRTLRDMHVALHGDPHGRTPIEQVRTNTKWIAGQRWFYRAVGAVIIAVIVTGSVELVRFVSETKAQAGMRNEGTQGRRDAGTEGSRATE